VIVVWGPPGDGTLRAALAALARRRARMVYVNQADVLRHRVDLQVEDGLRGRLEVPGRAIDLGAVTAAYLRPYDSADAPAVRATGERSPEADHARTFDERIWTWSELSAALIVNRPSAMASNDSKPSQGFSARAVGFEVPPTLITTDPEAVRGFASAHGEVIYKSISGVRSIVSRLAASDLDRLDDVAWCPTQFQALVPGTDVRVHVAGERVFASRIESSADDYRYGSMQILPYELDSEPASRCVALARALGLELAGIDLRRSPDGRWYCFEANPSPAFGCFGPEIEAAVADALAELLIAAPASSVLAA
jgi:hypothetical protein